ncbi:MAG: hypothetical protein C5B46_06060 [Proteobacteria bacterium]|nr:MAG: hypothetical protein C5B46_06060 [Pseudomonadota bacterium]
MPPKRMQGMLTLAPRSMQGTVGSAPVAPARDAALGSVDSAVAAPARDAALGSVSKRPQRSSSQTTQRDSARPRLKRLPQLSVEQMPPKETNQGMLTPAPRSTQRTVGSALVAPARDAALGSVSKRP